MARAGVVGAGTLASRVLGLGRDMAFAGLFTREATDAFFVAFTIPNALRQLLAEGAVSSAVVPVLASKLAKDTGGQQEDAKAFFARVRGLSLVVLTLVTILGVVFARPLCELFAGGYRDRPDQFERAVTLTRIVFPYIFFMGTAALGMAALHVNRRFAVASFAPGLLNVAFLVCAFALPPILAASGLDIAYAMGIGALLGGFLQVAAQWPSLRRLGYGSWPRFDLRDEGVRTVLRRIGPMTVGIGIYYVDLVLARRFLSELGPGAQSYFSWAMRVCDFPQGIFVMALSTAALPSLAGLAATGQFDEVRKTYAHGVRLGLFVALPASALLVVLAHPLVTLLFQRGQFDAKDAAETALALAWQGGAVWTVAMVRQTVPVFHALGDTRTPVLVSGLDLVAFLLLAVALRGPLGHVGVSIAVAGSSFVQMLLLLLFLQRRLEGIGLGEILVSAVRTGTAAALASAAGWASALAAARLFPGASGVTRALPGLLGALAFVAVFLAVSTVLRSPELRLLAGAFRRKFTGSSASAGILR